LFLAALYESWSVPFAVLGVVPISSFGAFFALYYLGLENSVYAQIGLVTLIGLCAKTSILIVEYCKEKQEKQGMPLVQAVLEASMLRLRPILMTALSFVLGVVSLVVANGAGAAARVNLGWTVLGGMLAVTFLSIFFVPALYVFIYKRSHNKDSNI
jgi:HAE1 family hydrophobic/amphiphilic exporter-1